MQGVYIEYLGNSLEMPYGETIVGRDVKCALRFNEPAVSRRHLRLIRRQDEVFIEDLGSSNGTLLNGRKVAAPLPIEDGDRVQFGSRELTIRITDESLDDNTTLVLAGSPSLDDQRPSTLVLRGSHAPRSKAFLFL